MWAGDLLNISGKKMNKTLPLNGIKILDLSRLLPGPYCTMLLADMGAEVIKIEEPKRGDYHREWLPKKGKNSGYFIGINRNKKSITLDLKKEKGREIFYKLVKDADVVVESFRPGVTEKLKIDFNTVKNINPQIIYLSLTGFGQNSSWKNRPAHDLNFLALSGILSFSGSRDKKHPIIGIQIADYAGAVFGIIGIMAALLRREKIKEAQYLDIAMMDGLFSFLSMISGKFFIDGEIPEPGDGLLTGGFACYNIYETKDGRYITVGAIEEKFWERLCDILGKPEFKKYVYVPDKQKEIIEEFDKIFKTKTLEEWIKIFENEDVCVEPVLNLKEAFESNYAKSRNIVFTLKNKEDGEVKQIKNPVEIFPPVEMEYKSHPQMGEHTEEILLKAGYSKEDIEKFRMEKII